MDGDGTVLPLPNNASSCGGNAGSVRGARGATVSASSAVPPSEMRSYFRKASGPVGEGPGVVSNPPSGRSQLGACTAANNTAAGGPTAGRSFKRGVSFHPQEDDQQDASAHISTEHLDTAATTEVVKLDPQQQLWDHLTTDEDAAALVPTGAECTESLLLAAASAAVSKLAAAQALMQQAEGSVSGGSSGRLRRAPRKAATCSIINPAGGASNSCGQLQVIKSLQSPPPAEAKPFNCISADEAGVSISKARRSSTTAIPDQLLASPRAQAPAAVVVVPARPRMLSPRPPRMQSLMEFNDDSESTAPGNSLPGDPYSAGARLMSGFTPADSQGADTHTSGSPHAGRVAVKSLSAAARYVEPAAPAAVAMDAAAAAAGPPQVPVSQRRASLLRLQGQLMNMSVQYGVPLYPSSKAASWGTVAPGRLDAAAVASLAPHPATSCITEPLCLPGQARTSAMQQFVKHA